MKQKIPHRHSELIKKWADDSSLKIQFKNIYTKEWKDIVNSPNWDEENEYRIKPEVIRYRVALLKNCDRKWCEIVNDERQEEILMSLSTFIEWKTDWIEVEI